MIEAAYPVRHDETVETDAIDKCPQSIKTLRWTLHDAEKSKTWDLFRSEKATRTLAREIVKAEPRVANRQKCWSNDQRVSNLENAIDGVLNETIEEKSPIDQNRRFRKTNFSRDLEAAIRAVCDARISFINGLLLPIVVHFVTTGAAFYQAYNKLGDNDTAHSLAYGALYSWLLIVVVVGNCVAASANAKVVATAVKNQFTLGGSRVPLRRWYTNVVEWECGLTDIGVSTRLSRRMGKSDVAASTNAFGPRFYLRFAIGQFLSWACVAFFGSCAITISYTTPTVGWGCRSLNHLLYIVFSALVALFQVVRQHLAIKYTPRQDVAEQIAEKQDTKKRYVEGENDGLMASNISESKTSPYIRISRIIYGVLVGINAFILICGTIFHFVGLYRSNSCSAIFTKPSSAVIQLAKHTQLHLDQARRYWWSTGYVAYCIAWIICAIAIAVRKYIHLALDIRFNGSEETAEEETSTTNIEKGHVVVKAREGNTVSEEDRDPFTVS
ncbi:hypothetical protein GLAREA_08596 [Glarea lozoyensis ATCC 20868]|uniref:Uncharacterized protein n=1 Tax=Glarea lozoyensis (strain ATCC 20868 / MF5171) TaxID=1116229 RepID=S3DDL5_GLAL2|nr:uncharacterized protein GLAREA_08596 [Glarea lozoyensis ATCC 20868]EPE24743.1 hypothetical protein GLAREA_08596 [Glarea lozoyensis ATCC 20868]